MIEDYEDNWFISIKGAHNLEHTFSDNAIHKIKNNYKDWDLISLKKNFNQKVKSLQPNLGNNVVVSLSGGIDSQTVCLSLKNNEIDFTAVTMVMQDDFNWPDVNSARKFCNKHGIRHIEIPVDPIPFLKSKLHDYADKYQCPSPQFNLHFYFYELVLDKINPSCLILGGNQPIYSTTDWTYMYTVAQKSWINFKKENNINMIGEFQMYSLDFCLLFMLTYAQINENSYENKCQMYRHAGFDISPQYDKLTGFERLKSYFNKTVNGHGVFNRMFRVPLERKYPNKIGLFVLDSDTKSLLTHAHNKINTSRVYKG